MEINNILNAYGKTVLKQILMSHILKIILKEQRLSKFQVHQSEFI